MRYYRLTPLEQTIEDMYRRLDVTKPEQLTIPNIAAKLGIWVYYLDMPSRVVESRGLYSMNINRQLSPEEQWEDFLHELCHVLRHAGNQIAMSELMLDMQEAEAGHFQLYAAIPFSMVRGLELPQRSSEIVELLSLEFGVTCQLAQRRLEQIQRRILQGVLDEETARRRKHPQLYHTAGWSDETRRVMNKLQLLLERRNEYGRH